MARHEPELVGHEESIQELFAFVREATQLTNGKLEKLFGFCPEGVTTTGRDWGRWADANPARRVTPYRKRIQHVLRVVRTGYGEWNKKKVNLITEYDEFWFRISQALEFSENIDDHEEIFQCVDQDLLLYIFGVGARHTGLKGRLAELEFLLNKDLTEFADKQLQILAMRQEELIEVMAQMQKMPRGLVPVEATKEDKIQTIINLIESSINEIEEVSRLLDYSSGYYPTWICLDLITQYMTASKQVRTGA